MRPLYPSLAIIIVFLFAGDLLAQTTQPLMKITVKDGKIVNTESLSGPKSNLRQGPEQIGNRGPGTSGSYEPSPDRNRVKVAGTSSAAGTTNRNAVGTTSGNAIMPSGKDEGKATVNRKPLTPVDQNQLFGSTPAISGPTSKQSPASLPQRVSYGSAVLDGTASVRWMGDNIAKPQGDGPVSPMSTTTILNEGFEAVWPAGSWSVYSYGTTEATWDDASYRAYSGGWSAWCANGGALGIEPGVGVNYPDNLNSWMVYGPFDLSDVSEASLTLKNYLDSESGWDYFKWMASTDGVNFDGYEVSGNSSGWVDRTLDLADVPGLGDLTGSSQVWIALIFYSDYIYNYEGAYVDDVLLTKTTTGLADLRPSNLIVSSLDWAVGATSTAWVTEANDGAGSANAHYSRYYLSTDVDINPAVDTQLGGDILFQSIPAFSTQEQEHSFTVPSGDGVYYVGVIADYYGGVAETDEADNYFVWSGITLIGAPPDLTCTYISLTSTAWGTGQSVTATIGVDNFGEGAAGSHYTNLYLSDNTSISDLDVLLAGDIFWVSVEAGSYLDLEATFDVPDVADGTYYVGVLVDYYNEVVESDESNNAFYRSGSVLVTVPDYVDLEGYSMGLSTESWSAGASVTAYFTELNNGTIEAGTHSSRLYLSADLEILVDDPWLGESDLVFSATAAGAMQQQDLTFTVPAVANGTYYVMAIIDYYSQVIESDEDDNIIYRTLPISVFDVTNAPDLLWTGLTFNDDTWSFDESITGQLTVANAGLSTAAAHTSSVYLSTNDIISESDVLLGDVVFDPINSGFDQLQELLFSVPSGNGSYYVGALVDVYFEIPESDELNNGGARGSQVFFEGGAPYVELAATYLDLTTTTWSVGSSVTAELTEENTGTLEAGLHHSRLVLSDNITISESDLQLGDDLVVDIIQPGTSGTATGSFDVPEAADGEYYVGIFTDVLMEVVELDESNNIRYRTGPVLLQGSVPDILVTPSSLTINETSESSSPNRPAPPSSDVHGEFVPNQLIVKFKSNVGADAGTMRTASKGLEGLNTRYKVSRVHQMGKSVKQLSAQPTGNLLLMSFENATDIAQAMSDYKKLDIVEFAEPNYIVKHNDLAKSDFEPSDSFFGSQWGLKNTGNAISYTGSTVGLEGQDINVTGAWDITRGSPSIIVAVIDDGVDVSHPEFTGRLVAGYDFVNDDTDPSPLSTDGHGNACAGIIGAANDGVGVIGVAPGVKIMPIKAMQDQSGFNSDIIDAIYFAVDNGARVISMSLGGTSYSSAFEAAVNYAVSNGVVVLSAAGNEDVDNLVTPHYPASYTNSISVGAMSPCGLRKTPETCDGEFWWGSNYGNLDFLSPGTRIYTTDISGAGGYSSDNYTNSFNGTSAATPFAAGVAALILSADPTLSPAEVRQIMQASAVDVGDAGYDAETGHGRLDALSALQLIEGGGSDDLLTITNAGQASLEVTSISSNSAWLTVSGYETPFNLNAGQSAVLSVDVDWTGLTGANFGELTISSNDPDQGAVVIPVTANSGDVTIYTVMVSANPPDYGTVIGSGGYGPNQQATLTAIPGPQREFINWTENGEQVASSPEYAFEVTGGRSLVANFQLQTYTIFVSADPGDAGLVTGEGLYQIGQTVTLTAESLGNYTFVNWTENDEIVSLSPTYTFTANADRVIVGHFSVEFFQVSATADPAEGGTITGAGAYLPSQTASMSAQASSGFTFSSWKENGIELSTDPNYIFTVTATRSLVATFAVQTRTITVVANPEVGGSVTGGDAYAYGATATLQAAPKSGYAFVNWTSNGAIISSTPSYSFTVTVDRDFVANFLSQQTVTFAPLAARTFGEGSFALTATSTSNLAVSYSSSDPTILAISGSTATILNAGTVDITATQPGNFVYAPATPVVQPLTINKANQAITFAALAAKTVSDAPYNLTATASSGLTVIYESSNQSVATVVNNTVTPVGVGSTFITASQGGNNRYHAATSVQRELVVNKGAQTIFFGSLPPKSFNDAPFALTANSSAGLGLTFTSSNTSVATINGNMVTIVGAGTSSISASQVGNAQFNAAAVVQQTLTVNKAVQTISFGSLAQVQFSPTTTIQLTATSTSNLPVSYSSSNTSVATISGSVLSLTGAGSTTITASQAGNNNYDVAATIEHVLSVQKSNQTIIFEGIPDKIQGGAPFDLVVSVSSGLPLTITSPQTSRVTISNKTVTMLQPGPVTISAAQPGNTNYNTATTRSWTFCINPAKPTIQVTGVDAGFPTLVSSSSTGNQWYKNDNLIPGATGSSFVTSSQADVGIYKVRVTIEACVGEFSNPTSLIVTGLHGELASEISVYPNPFDSELHVDVSGFGQAGDVVVNMFDMAGRLQRTATGTGTITLDVSRVSSGAYILQIQNGEQVLSRKVFKIR